MLTENMDEEQTRSIATKVKKGSTTASIMHTIKNVVMKSH